MKNSSCPPRPKQVLAQARAAPEHLPELGLRADDLEEHQIDDLGHVDAGVQHIDRDGDVRHLLLVGEVVDQALRVLGLVGHDAGEVALVVRVVGVEALGDEVGVVVVLGEDDGLAQPVAARHLLALGHQGFEHLVDGVGVEQPLVDRLGIDLVGWCRPRSTSSASHSSFSSSERSSYLMPSRWNLSGTEIATGGTR
jgi:hypothetical protein